MASKRTADMQHRWLSQVEVTGVVFSEPVLAEAAPSGFPNLDKKVLAQFHKAREIWNLPKGMVKEDPQVAWTRFILEEILRHRPNDWLVGAAIPAGLVARLPAQQETIRPTRVLVEAGTPLLAMLEVPRSQSLDRPWVHSPGRWKASPTTKLERLLRESGLELGMITNGESWRLLVASPSETASWLTWTATTWADSPLTLAAFRDLLGEERFFAGARDQTALHLIRRSRERQADVAEELGNQAREALAIFVATLDAPDSFETPEIIANAGEDTVFESSVAFVMRLLFLLFAEENRLLPHGEVAYDRSYGVLHLLTELEHQFRSAPERLNTSFAAYPRLLATFRLIHQGSMDSNIHVAAHEGSFFDPNRFPLLEGRERSTTTASVPKIPDAEIRRILRSLKYAHSNGVRQLVSYRTLAVEQIGHMYEGLLDRCVRRNHSEEPVLLFTGSAKVPDPEPVCESALADRPPPEVYKVIAKATGRTASTVKKHLERRLDGAAKLNAEMLPMALSHLLTPHARVRTNGLFVAPGQDRRSQGAHYTPPTLTEPIVRRTLEHLVLPSTKGSEPGTAVPSPRFILALKVCDPAMGSGAFLVQTVRYLAERLVDSWEQAALRQASEALVMPFAEPSQGMANEAIMPHSREERLVWARRYVAENCIYGVDLNPHAVEMAKLSLWLTTASKGRPFTFLDHALKHGDSLVGLSRDQIARFSWEIEGSKQEPLSGLVSAALARSQQKRDAIPSFGEDRQDEKGAALEEAESAKATIAAIGDAIVNAFFASSNDSKRRTALSSAWAEVQAMNVSADKELTKASTDALNTPHGPVHPFHWDVEFPEVFARDNPGFDAIVGNPPFLGGKRIGTVHGTGYASFAALHKRGLKGAADLCAYFLLRANNDWLREGGACGCVVTNSISEGATRVVGLRSIVGSGSQLYGALTTRRWPGKASVLISVVHFSRSPVWNRDKTINDRVVPYLSTYLDQVACEDPPPSRRHPFECFSGVYLYGDGFMLTDDEYGELCREDAKTPQVVRRYLIGDDLNNAQNGEPMRWAIDFGDCEQSRAMKYGAAYERIVRLVKPKRDKQTQQVHESRFWVHWDRRVESFERLSRNETVFVRSIVSNLHIVAPARLDWLLSKDLAIFGTSRVEHFAVLQSTVHELWARRFSTTMKADMRYSISGAFNNFPWPKDVRDLKNAGQRYLDTRRVLMEANGWTLRQVHGAVNDESVVDEKVQSFRAAIVDLDASVCLAYGMDEVALEHDFRLAEWLPIPEVRFVCSPEARGAILTALLDSSGRG